MVKLSHPAALGAGVSAVALASVRAEPGLVIRAAGFADRPALAVLAAAAFAQGATALLPAGLRRSADAARFEGLFAEAAAQGATLLLAERDGRALGCVLAEPVLAGPPGSTARLTGVWVCPAVTGQGIGSALLRALEELMAAAGVGSLRVRVPSGHLRALGLFRRRGYAMQAAGRRTEPVLQVTLPHSVLAKPLLARPVLDAA
ncbi:GNAT family N-acetyltransferase [Roseomonas sp. USHLN139]|uniref:GNAT family N-acetyltransferase n=1 Tax=Roseomonas sp. USHLN139 TaxID=3081298 RepID=UPI003B01BC14